MRRRVALCVGCLALLGGVALGASDSVSAARTPLTHEDKWFHSDGVTDYYTYFSSPAAERAWLGMETTKERLEAVEIPADVLGGMSTRGLAETVLNYPLQVNLWVYDTPAAAIRAVSEQFNGIAALTARKDGPVTLLGIYANTPVARVVAGSDSPMLEFTTLQYLLAGDAVLERLGSEGRRELIQAGLERYQEITTCDSIAEEVPVDATVWLIARAAAAEFEDADDAIKAHPALADYLQTGQLVADDAELEAIEQARTRLLERHGYAKVLQDQ
jgi:hypothetical protein